MLSADNEENLKLFRNQSKIKMHDKLIIFR